MIIERVRADANLNALVKVVRTRVNLGNQPEFIMNEQGEYLTSIITQGIEVRQVKYSTDKVVDNFPLLISLSRLADTQEMNLFLIHRFLGQYSIKRNETKGHSEFAESKASIFTARGNSVDIATIGTSAKHLAAFLRWLIDKKVDWAESMSEPLNERISNLDQLPIWRFRNDLIYQVESGELSYEYANNRIQVVKTFYEWAWKNNRIQSIPFEYVKKTIYRRSKKETGSTSSDLGNLLFGMGFGPTQRGGIPVFTTNLALPKKITQKQASPEESLQPYSLTELGFLLNSDTLKKDNYALWVAFAYRCGLRAMDIVQLNYCDLCNPDIDPAKQFKVTLLASKGKKTRRFTIARDLMKKLWFFANTDDYAAQRVKFEIKHGLDKKVPLFINRTGDRVISRSVSNLIPIVRAEQNKKGIPVLRRTFHDLRATFATYLASYMLEAGHSDEFIKVTLTRELGHNNFETSKKYLDFAKTDSAFNNIAAPWVTEIYKPLQTLLCKETKALIM